MMSLGQFFAKNLEFPAIFELIGDVGAGKTTFTRGLASGLGVEELVTSPSFTISKRYCYPRITAADGRDLAGELVHYDFYRLDDPGLMREELAETLAEPNAVVVIEWGGDVAKTLPENRYQLQIALNEDGSRNITCNLAAEPVENLWKNQHNLCKTCGKSVDKNDSTVENSANTVENPAIIDPSSASKPKEEARKS